MLPSTTSLEANLKIFLLSLLLMPYVVFAGDVSLVKITNEEDSEVSVMFVRLHENGDVAQFGKHVFLNGQKLKTDLYGDSLDYSGIVLERKRGRDIAVLRGLNIDGVSGGALEIDFLYNGITGRRLTTTLEFVKIRDEWQVQKNGSVVKHLHCVSNKKPFVGTIGIKKIIIK